MAVNAPTNQTTNSLSYELYCTICDFETTIEGDAHDVLDTIDAHQKERTDALEHFVEFESKEAKGRTNGSNH